MTPEIGNGLGSDPSREEFDPEVKWPAINQVGASAPGYLTGNQRSTLQS